MLLCHVDDVISISTRPMDAMEGVKAVFKLKGDKTEVPESCLGGKMRKVKTDLENESWTLSLEKHVKPCKHALSWRCLLSTETICDTNVSVSKLDTGFSNGTKQVG